MAQCDQRQFVAADVEGIDDTVIARAEPKLGASLQARMRKIIQAPAQFADVGQNSALDLRSPGLATGTARISLPFGTGTAI